MKIYASKIVSKKLKRLKDTVLLDKINNGINHIQAEFSIDGNQHNSNIHKLNFQQENIFSYRIDTKLRLLFTYTKDNDHDLIITLLDIVKPDDVKGVISM